MKTLAIRILAVVACILAGAAFLAAVASGFTVPAWVLPTAVFLVALAVALIL